MTEAEIKALCDRVRQTAYDVHLYLGHGHLEKVYENALAHRSVSEYLSQRRKGAKGRRIVISNEERNLS